MLLINQILMRTIATIACATALTACGQQGPLYLPDTGGAHRTTLPESLLPAHDAPQTVSHPTRKTSAPQLP